MRQRRARRLLVVYLVALAVLTLIPVIGPAVTATFVHLAEFLGAGGSARTTQLVDSATNVVLFIPAGVLLVAAVPRLPPLAVWLICVTASSAVELAQAVAIPGRSASLRDIATNALGAALGVLLAMALRRRSPTT